jgi:hypothetical protein
LAFISPQRGLTFHPLGELKGNQQANEVAQGIGSLGGLEGLKKQI